MRTLIFGGREYNDRESVYYTLDDYHAKTPITLVIHGSCRSKLAIGPDVYGLVWSADELAEQWAKDNYIPYLGVPAVWRTKHGGKIDKSAGPKRNALMIEKGRPQVGIGFPGGNGTADMAKKLEAAGIPTIIIASKT